MDNKCRLIRFPEKNSFFLFGPRGTGKTTWLKQAYPDAICFDLLNPDTFRIFQTHPEQLLETVKAYPHKTVFIIDEIQKIPALLNVVHILIEEKKGWQFILTGSSARKLKQSGVDLLAGRAVLRNLHPFMAFELGQEFDLEKSLKYGLLPLIYLADNPQDTQNAYIGIYLREEVQQEGLIRNLGNFSRFLETMSFSQASILTTTNIARDCYLHRKVVDGYISIMEDLLLGFKLPVFSKRAKRATISHPKFYYFDCGIYSSLRPKGPLDRPEEIHGIALETLIAQHLRAWCDYSQNNDSLYFWRTKAGTEIDFIIYGEKSFYAIEVKNAAHIRPQDIKALKTFSDDYPESTPLLLYRGHTRLKKDNILCLPVEEFLINLKPGKLLE